MESSTEEVQPPLDTEDLEERALAAGFAIPSPAGLLKMGFLQRNGFEPAVADKMAGILTQRREYLRNQLEDCPPEKLAKLQGAIGEVKAQLEHVQAKNYDSQRNRAFMDRGRRLPEY